MEKLKSFSDYPSVPSTIFTPENLAKYDGYIQAAIEQSRKMELAAREWASRNVIWFHDGR